MHPIQTNIKVCLPQVTMRVDVSQSTNGFFLHSQSIPAITSKLRFKKTRPPILTIICPKMILMAPLVGLLSLETDQPKWECNFLTSLRVDCAFWWVYQFYGFFGISIQQKFMGTKSKSKRIKFIRVFIMGYWICKEREKESLMFKIVATWFRRATLHWLGGLP